MGGLIEDRIIIALRGDKLTASQVVEGLEKIGERSTYATVSRHLKKMYDVKVLCRERGTDGGYVYWNPCPQTHEWPDDPRQVRKVVVKFS